MKKYILVACLAGSVSLMVACGNDSGKEEIGCDWFAGDNCWKSTVNQAKDCLPDENTSGTLSDDGTECTYEDGTKVIFNNPYDSTALDKDTYLWDFEIRGPSGTCLSYKEQSDGGFEVSSSAGTYKESGSAMVDISCPNGSEYSANGFKLLSCEQGLSILPGKAYSWTENSIYFSLLGFGENALLIIGCSR